MAVKVGRAPAGRGEHVPKLPFLAQASDKAGKEHLVYAWHNSVITGGGHRLYHCVDLATGEFFGDMQIDPEEVLPPGGEVLLRQTD